MLVALLRPRFTFQRPPLAFWWFAAHVGLFTLSFLLHGVVHEEVFYYRLFYLVFLHSLALPAYQLMRYEGLAKEALVTLILSSLVVSVLMLTGIFKTIMPDRRVTFLNQNPAFLACILAIAMVALIGWVSGPEKPPRVWRYLAWPGFAILGLAVIATGTRGAVLALGVGLFAFLFRPGGYGVKLRSVGLLVFLAGTLLLLGYRSTIMVDRVEDSVEGGDLAKREVIYPTSLHMILEDPLLGWGPVQNDYEIELRVQYPNKEYLEAHNLFLEVLTGTGILGGLPFFVGLWLCFQAAWKARRGTHSITPLAMLVTALVSSMGMPWLYSKTFWLVIAYTLARRNPWEEPGAGRILPAVGSWRERGLVWNQSRPVQAIETNCSRSR
ncbi:MAG: O-antigen ligase family protein [Planctomycetes bacterium]|nr:O-antigen ligase family protein [Planctomycetota bacterium]